VKLTITNTSPALQGVHSTEGLVFIETGETRQIDVAEDYVERVKSLPHFALGDKPTAEPQADDGRDANGDTPGEAQLRGLFNASWEQARQKAGALEGESLTDAIQRLADNATTSTNFEASLRAALGLKEGEGIIEAIGSLKDRVAELELAAEEAAKGRPLPTKLEATHRGRGSFSIMDGNELIEGLDKEAADKFNALSDEDKAKYVTANTKAK
jgi:hypothetical protein